MRSPAAIAKLYTDRALQLIRLGNGQSLSVRTELRKLASGLRALLDGQALPAMRKRELTVLLKKIEAMIAERFGAVSEQQSVAAEELANIEAAWAAEASGFDVDIDEGTLNGIASGLLKSSYGDRTKVTDAVIDEWYEMWMREGNRRAMLANVRQYVSGDVEGKIRSVRVPVLLLWGEKNPRVPLPLAYEFQKLLVNAPSVKLEVLKGIGHMAVQEAPDETARIVRQYLDAELQPQPAPMAEASAAASPARI